MCLIAFQLREHPTYKLILAGNRDEHYERPTKDAHFWEDEPNILAGRDLLQMGTWLGITKNGRFAAITNYREPNQTDRKKSRGAILRNYLSGDMSATNFLSSLKKAKDQYPGFNLLAGNVNELYYYSNVQDEVMPISPGTYGLSNHLLDTPWPKVIKAKQNLRKYVNDRTKISIDTLFDLLTDAEKAPKHELPKTGVDPELEHILSPLFIRAKNYGTRSSTVVLIDYQNKVTFAERIYHNGKYVKQHKFEFKCVIS